MFGSSGGSRGGGGRNRGSGNRGSGSHGGASSENVNKRTQQDRSTPSSSSDRDEDRGDRGGQHRRRAPPTTADTIQPGSYGGPMSYGSMGYGQEGYPQSMGNESMGYGPMGYGSMGYELSSAYGAGSMVDPNAQSYDTDIIQNRSDAESDFSPRRRAPGRLLRPQEDSEQQIQSQFVEGYNAPLSQQGSEEPLRRQESYSWQPSPQSELQHGSGPFVHTSFTIGDYGLGADAYPCDQCLSRFNSAQDLDNHRIGRHAGIVPVCTSCNVVLRKLEDLHKHVEKEHHDLPTLRCPVDGCEFYDPQRKMPMQRMSHMAKWHMDHPPPDLDQLVYDKPPDPAASSTQAQRGEEGPQLGHIQHGNISQRFECTKCGAHFADKYTRTRHEKTHEGPWNYFCRAKMCKMGFATMNEQDRHVDTAHRFCPFRDCQYFNVNFVTEREQTRHREIHHNDKTPAISA